MSAIIDRKIFTDKADIPIDTLKDMYQRGVLEIQPEFQRYTVWDDKKKSLFIESLLLELPVPIIYLAEDESGKNEVIDGQQRLTAVLEFLGLSVDTSRKPSRKLKTMKQLTDLQGKTFKEIDEEWQNKLLYKCKIPIVTILRPTDTEVKYDLFERLNRGAVILNEQEVRNCVYRGPYNELLKKLALNKRFLKLFGVEGPDDRMKHEEYILRFFAFLNTNYENYNGKLKQFLNTEMETNRFLDESGLSDLESSFKQAIDLVYSVFGPEKAFRRFEIGDEENPNGAWKKRTNLSIYDIVMHFLAIYPKNEVMRCADSIREELIFLMTTNEDFSWGLGSTTTTSKARVHTRFNIWQTHLGKIIKSFKKERRLYHETEKEQLYKEREKRCGLCGNKITVLDDATVHHNFEYWKGGRTNWDNAVLAHRYCNLSAPKG